MTNPVPGVSIADKPNLAAWVERIGGRPAVQRGMNVPYPNAAQAALQDPSIAKEAREAGAQISVPVPAKKT